MAKLYDEITRRISDSTMSETEKQAILKKFLEMQNQKANVLITGATGCGKSSTINALFNTEKAKVGTGVDPETMEIAKYELGSLTLWDSPGLGDGTEADERHSKGIKELLLRKDEHGEMLIDVVIVILDGSSRDMGTSYELIRAVISPCLKEDNRLIVGINQADMAMKGKHWNDDEHKPDEVLQQFLKEKEESVIKRIKEGTGRSVRVISYSAGYKEEGKPQEQPYNLSKLLYFIIESIPAEKRINVVAQINEDQRMWTSDDEIQNYRQEIVKSSTSGFVNGLKNASVGAASGAALGAAIGSVIPVVGTAIGAAFGTLAGAIGGFISSWF